MTTVGSLCSGYGGLDLGLALAVGPLRHAWHVEYDKHPSAILAHRFPGVPNYGDVKHTDWTQVEPVDWLTAGYPCQPFSAAGHKKGTDDERHLWPHVAVAIGVLRPRRVLLENVARHLDVGFDEVLGDLAALGYDASWGVVRASDAGAPHSRARLFVVAAAADTEGVRRPERRLPRREEPQEPSPADCSAARDWGRYRDPIARWERIVGRPAPAPSESVRGRLRENLRAVEWLMGLPDGWVTDVPGLSRQAQGQALGNGVVPQQCALALRMLGVTPQAVAA